MSRELHYQALPFSAAKKYVRLLGSSMKGKKSSGEIKGTLSTFVSGWQAQQLCFLCFPLCLCVWLWNFNYILSIWKKRYPHHHSLIHPGHDLPWQIEKYLNRLPTQVSWSKKNMWCLYPDNGTVFGLAPRAYIPDLNKTL